jgi:hypothetical protein
MNGISSRGQPTRGGPPAWGLGELLTTLSVKKLMFSNTHFLHYNFIIYYFLWICSPAWAMASCGSAAQHGLWPPRHTRFLDHTQRRATAGRTPLDE